MLRRHILLGMTAGLALLGTTLSVPAVAPSDILNEVAATSSATRLIEADDLTAVYYDPGLTRAEILARIPKDAEILGLPMVRSMIAGKLIVFQATREEVESRLSQAEGIPVVATAPVLHPRGKKHPSLFTALTSQAILTLHPKASEAQKEAYYAQMGFRRIRELPNGQVIVDTRHQPGAPMIGYVDALVNQSALVVDAKCDYVLHAEAQASSDAIQIEDTFFDQQWYLDATRENTFGSAESADEDLDAPRAWMFNRRNLGSSTGHIFGSPDVVVAVFDTGLKDLHEDLAANIDDRMGTNYVDAGPPRPKDSLMGNHGTAMAGVIAAAKNDKGIVGIAPGVRLYGLRVLGEDYGADPRDTSSFLPNSDEDIGNYGANLSANSVAIEAALQESIFQDIDVNLHSYTLGVDNLDSEFVADVDTVLRQSFESGRRGYGTTNVAAAGNFFSQVEYPASSFWTFAVGGVTSNGDRIPQSNWGGLGIDFVMPSFGPASPSGAGILSTDLPGTAGLQGADPFTKGNEEGKYAANGNVNSFSPDVGGATFQRFYGGTSYSAAMAAGVVALMYSDERYRYLPPLLFDETDPDTADIQYTRLTRGIYRTRAPLTRTDTNILSSLQSFADLPSYSSTGIQNLYRDRYDNPELLNNLLFINQFHEMLGFGRLNPANTLAPDEGIPGPDGGYDALLYEEPIYSVRWNAAENSAPAGIREGADEYEALTKGWAPVPGDTLTAYYDFFGDEAIRLQVSPYLSSFRQLYLEGGEVETPAEGEPDGPPNVIYAWTDSWAVAPAESEDIDTSQNFVYNPEGTYWQGRPISLRSSYIDFATTNAVNQGVPGDVPMVLTVFLAHELGNENASQLNALAGYPTNPLLEIDTIDITVGYYAESGGGGGPKQIDPGSRFEVPIESITGDSTANPKAPLEPAIVTRFESGAVEPVWRGHGTTLPTERYIPWVDNEEMIIRPYRFLVPPIPTDFSAFDITLTLNPGSSYLPTWFIDYDQDPPTIIQMFNVERDSRGFILYGVDVHAFKQDIVTHLDVTNIELGGGYIPTWTASEKDVLGLGTTGGAAGFLVRFAPDRLYISDPTDPASVHAPKLRSPKLLTFFNDQITGLKGHPYYERVAVTIDSPDGDGVYVMSTDGVNLERVADPSLSVGAREPNWSPNGRQLIYCSEDSVRIVNFIQEALGDETNYEIETIIDEDSFLTDFRSPIFNGDSGLVFFAARLKDPAADNSLNLYMATRNGRIISYGDADGDGYPDPIVRGWEGVDFYDLDITRQGDRLLFVANTEDAPEIDDTDGSIITPAVPSMNTSMFILENIQNVSRTNQPPIYQQIVPSLFITSGTVVKSVRWPRVNPASDELVWVGFQTEMSANSGYALSGEVVRQPMPTRPGIPQPDPITPRPTPDVTPTATPPHPSNAQISRVGEINFLASEEGWTFNPSSFTGDEEVIDSFDLIDTQVRRIQPGVAAFLAASSDRLEQNRTLVATLQFRALREGTAQLRMLNETTRVSSAQNNISINVPTVLNDDMPTTAGEARIYIEPSVINVSAGQVFNVQVRVDPNMQNVYGIEGYVGFDPDPSFLAFLSGQVYRPVFNRLVGDGALVLRSPNTNNTFGYWESPTAGIRAAQNAMLLYRAHVSATPETPDGMAPTLRLRVNSLNLESAFGSVTNSTGDGTLVPVADEIKNVDLLFKPPAGLFDLHEQFRDYRLAFDLLNFLPGNIDPNGGLALQGIDLYRLDDQPRYHALWGFYNPGVGTSLSLQAVGLSGLEGNLTISLRRCCELASTEVAAATGSAKAGVILNTTNLGPGNYTLVVSVENHQDIALTWDSHGVELVGSVDDDCPAGEEGRYTSGLAADACENKVIIYGNGRDPADSSKFLTSIQEPFYDGVGFFENSSRDPKETKSVVTGKELLFESDLSDGAERSAWVEGSLADSPFSLPTFGSTDEGITLAARDRDGVFGFWDRTGIALPDGALDVSEDSPVVIIKAAYRFTIRGDELAPGVTFDPTSVPDIRPRLMTNDLQRAVEGLLVSWKHGATVPAPGKPREVELYLVLERVPENIDSLIASFDILAFYPEAIMPFRTVSNIPVEMELLRIERIHIPNYPMP